MHISKGERNRIKRRLMTSLCSGEMGLVGLVLYWIKYRNVIRAGKFGELFTR